MAKMFSMNFEQKQTQSLKQTQRLIMSPQMQQAIQLLQMPVLELSTMIEGELEQNPILEGDEAPNEDDPANDALERDTLASTEDSSDEGEVSFDDNDFEILKRLDDEFRDFFNESGSYSQGRNSEEDKLKAFLDSSIQAEESLFEFLMTQARETFDEQEDISIAEILIGNLDEKGFLSTDLEEISLLNGLERPQILRVLESIKTFEPYGVGAKNLQESLQIQLRCHGKGDSLAYRIVAKHYDDLLHNRIPVIQKSTGLDPNSLQEIIKKDILPLDLNPGAWHARSVTHFITPDVTIVQEGEAFEVKVHDEELPPIRINSKYLRMLDQKDLPEETREYIQKKVASGKWLLRNIHQRNDTLQRIAQSLARRQKKFFANPEGQLSPLTMKDLAKELDLHESTIARAVANKYLHCPRGLLPLRSFFTNAYTTDVGKSISADTVKQLVKEIVDGEDKHKPYSDEVISSLIQERGVTCKRRTVTKYRKELGIGNASQRRKFS